MASEPERPYTIAPRERAAPDRCAARSRGVRRLGVHPRTTGRSAARVGTPLRAPFEGLWRARRGEYRLRYRIDVDSRQVVVLDIDHRRDAYRH